MSDLDWPRVTVATSSILATPRRKQGVVPEWMVWRSNGNRRDQYPPSPSAVRIIHSSVMTLHPDMSGYLWRTIRKQRIRVVRSVSQLSKCLCRGLHTRYLPNSMNSFWAYRLRFTTSVTIVGDRIFNSACRIKVLLHQLSVSAQNSMKRTAIACATEGLAFVA